MEHPDVETARLQELYARRVARQGTAPGCPTPEAILALVRREGGEHERLATLEHVMSCAACHREYEWLQAVDEAAVEAGGEPAGVMRPAWWRGAPRRFSHGSNQCSVSLSVRSAELLGSAASLASRTHQR